MSLVRVPDPEMMPSAKIIPNLQVAISASPNSSTCRAAGTGEIPHFVKQMRSVSSASQHPEYPLIHPWRFPVTEIHCRTKSGRGSRFEGREGIRRGSGGAALGEDGSSTVPILAGVLSSSDRVER